MKIVTMQTRARGTVTVIRTIDYKKFVSGCEYLLDIVTCPLLTGAQEEGALLANRRIQRKQVENG